MHIVLEMVKWLDWWCVRCSGQRSNDASGFGIDFRSVGGGNQAVRRGDQNRSLHGRLRLRVWLARCGVKINGGGA
jgi:hypothetical protein